MTVAILNPGTGFVPYTTPLRAARNIRHFCAELKLDGVECRSLGPNPEEGRWHYALRCGRRHVYIWMPGCQLKIVRDLWRAKTFESLAAPRLYTNDEPSEWGSSYNWDIALDSARDHLSPPQKESTFFSVPWCPR